jgi:hypothetical protein
LIEKMDHDLLMDCQCWLGGGTEIVLDLGEYRLSKDAGFLCADASGYGKLRFLAATHGAPALFRADIQEERATAFRDAVDLGMLALRQGPFPEVALLKAEQAYPGDIGRKLVLVLERLSRAEERRKASAALGMDQALLDAAVIALG